MTSVVQVNAKAATPVTFVTELCYSGPYFRNQFYMERIIELLSQPWPWYVSGPIISFVMLTLLLFGKRFGISSNLRTMCSILGAGKHCAFFKFDWKAQIWNLVFALGLVVGGMVSHVFLTPSDQVTISHETIMELRGYGLVDPGKTLAPHEVFSWEGLTTFKGIVMIVVGGFFVGFGTRYAGGCTSGHAISGLSELQLPSLIAVIGFFIGGLAVTYFLLPQLLTL